MAQKKLLKDVQINETVYGQKGSEEPVEWIVVNLSTSHIKIWSTKGDRIAPRKTEDLTAFNFTAYRENDPNEKYYHENIFINKIDAIKSYRKHLDTKLKNIFAQNEKFLQQLQDCNKEIRKYDDLIIKESTK